MRKATLFVIVALMLSTFAGGQALAAAQVQQVVIDGFTCHLDCESQDVSSIFGAITCEQGGEYIMRVNLRQDGKTRAVGRASGTCTGTKQSWTTNFVDNPLPLDCQGSTITGQGRVFSQPEFSIPQQVVYCPNGYYS